MNIEKVAVIGAGVMGAGIAAHITNAGIPVYLLDIVPKDAKNRRPQFRHDEAIHTKNILKMQQNIPPSLFLLTKYHAKGTGNTRKRR